MSNSAPHRVNRGAYDFPFSGVGIEYYPLGSDFDRTGLILHEVGYIPKGKKWNFPNVLSPFWRLYYNSDFGHFVKFDDKLYELGPKNLMLIPSHVLFHCIGKKAVNQFWIAFSINKSVSPKQKIPILLKPSVIEHSIIKTLEYLVLKNKDFAPTDTIYRYGLALMNIVVSRKEISWKPPAPPRLNEILYYIQDHLTENLSNTRLANIACLSIEGVSKMFRNHLGVSPAEYVTRSRIKEACRMLLQDDLSIEQITRATGFSNRNHFSRVFKKITNKGPAEFRRIYRK